jgi:LysR family cys regulon transcriptional activator
MNLQQLRYLQEIERCNLNISSAAEALYTSQPGVSQQIRQLEDELGIEIFVRNGKRIAGLTEPGRQVLEIAKRMMQDANNLRQVGKEYRAQDRGSLSIATTHTQARYALPPIIKQFMARYPNVKLNLHQGSPSQIAKLVEDGEADLAIATESLLQHEDLVTMPCYQWNHCVITPAGHPLLEEETLSLEAVARYPIITYDFAFTGRSKINAAFEQRKLMPNIVLTAIDADVIKTYVELGLGVGIVARMAFIPERDTQLRMLDASHLFQSSTTRIALRKNEFLRGYTYHFIELFAPRLTKEVVNAAVHPNR